MPGTTNSDTSSAELITEAAGVKIFMTPFAQDDQHPLVKDTCSERKIHIGIGRSNCASGSSCGFHLSKSKWDPYPWISNVESGSVAYAAGLRTGDCLTNIDEVDVIGLRIKEVGQLIRRDDRQGDMKLSVWRSSTRIVNEEANVLALSGPITEVAKKLADAASGVVRAIECPVCLESSMPPVSQCVNGHIICVGCRPRATRCPVCRVRLGQGRCLLADNLHKVFRDSFDLNKEAENKGQSMNDHNIFDRLFGKNRRKKESSVATKNSRFLSKPCQLLLTKLFLGGLEKAASADNLTTTSDKNTQQSLSTGITREFQFQTKQTQALSQKLTLHDRTKSASTGELSRESNLISIENNTAQSVNSSSTSLASNAPNTPQWGGSTDSVFSRHVVCPLLKQVQCKEILTPNILLEHLSRVHEAPQVHFYATSVNLPMPLPLAPDAVYILHSKEDIFFFQCEGERFWMTSATRGNHTCEWALHGSGQNGTEIKLRRVVVPLEEPFILLPEHIALLPSVLQLHTLNVKLVGYKANNGLSI